MTPTIIQNIDKNIDQLRQENAQLHAMFSQIRNWLLRGATLQRAEANQPVLEMLPDGTWHGGMKINFEHHKELETLRSELKACDKENDLLRARCRDLEKHEYVCKKCGVRKDAEFTKGDF